ncbi:hypothetical protein Avbf_06980 [Armadillidium vulgare]|nr:hypothetical protein Avbf_06980 [Armadillidium vulgare]
MLRFFKSQIWRSILVSKEWSFTSDHVSTIRETRLATLICLYTSVDKIQPYVMLPHTGNSGSNPLTSCTEILQNVLSDHTKLLWSDYC